jgi:hypothetical protein
MLVARIERVSRSYYLSILPTSGLEDEAITELSGSIERASPRHQTAVGETMTVSLLCAHRYPEERVDGTSGFFGSVCLRSGQRSALAYIPAQAFWNLPSLLECEVGHIQLRFEKVRYGTGELTSVFIGPLEEMA